MTNAPIFLHRCRILLMDCRATITSQNRQAVKHVKVRSLKHFPDIDI